MRRKIMIASCVIFIGMEGCVATPYDLVGDSAPLEIRSVQTRDYDALDKAMTMRAVIATLQDLGFTIDQADVGLGVITGTRLQVSDLRMTVTVIPTAEERVSVRANARVGEDSITKAETYQDFFVALDKAMFLVRNNVN